MNLINDNIKQYILNLYLDYRDDIREAIKKHQLYSFPKGKFNIKSYLKIKKCGYITYSYLDNKKYKEEQFYKYGIIRLQQHFKNDKLHGISKGCYFNGILKYKYNYKNEFLHGIQINYHNDGTIKSKELYKDGVLKKKGLILIKNVLLCKFT